MNTPQTYTGPSYIGPNALMQQGGQLSQDYYSGAGQNNVNSALGAWNNSLDPNQALNAQGAFNPLQNYAFETGRALDENIRPGYASGAASAGQHGGYSSERHQGDILSQRNAQEAIARFGGELTGQLANQGLQNSLAAQNMAGNMFNLGAAPGEAMYSQGARDRNEAYTQQEMNNARTEFDQSGRMGQLERGYNLVGNAAQLGGTTESVQPGQQRDMFGTLLGAGMTAAGAMTGNPAMAMSGMSGMGGGMGMGQTGSMTMPSGGFDFNPNPWARKY